MGMTFAERIAEYENKGFSRSTATVNVLIEEAVSAIFEKYPDTFLLFGGASMVLFYDSRRHSGDLDLLVQKEQHAPTADELRQLLEPRLRESAEILGLPALQIETLAESGDSNRKLAVKADKEVLFTIDVSKVTSAIHSNIVELPLHSEYVQNARVKLPNRNLMLLYKVEAFLKRRVLKIRDAFDVKVLLDTGAKLDANLRVHLEDGLAAEQLENPAFIASRIDAITIKACEVELREFLPEDVYAELVKEDCDCLKSVMRGLLADWLEEK